MLNMRKGYMLFGAAFKLAGDAGMSMTVSVNKLNLAYSNIVPINLLIE